MKRWTCCIALVIAVSSLTVGCTVAPPRNPANLCDIFRQKPDWYDYAKAAAERWGTPIPVQMAIIAQESGYHEEIQPPRDWILGIIPWTRPSSAYGYTQALDSTWAWYKAETGNDSADRDDFDDAVDFVAGMLRKAIKCWAFRNPTLIANIWPIMRVRADTAAAVTPTRNGSRKSLGAWMPAPSATPAN